jgi:hypothetical protein
MLRRYLAIALFAAVSTFMFAQDVPLTNWTVPTYHASGVTGGLTTMADVTPGVGFVGIQPCRVADTRGNGAPITGGIFANSALRTWDLTGLCGLPAGTDAISANFTVVAATGIPAGSFLLAWPTGQAPPPTAIMTYGPGQIISNAAIVPLGPGEQLNVNVSGSTHIIMDVNGYFTNEYNPGVPLEVISASPFAIHGVTTSTSLGAIGVLGQAVATSGNIVGVWGESFSSTDFARGVMGQSRSSTGMTFGVIGLTDSSTSGAAGVFGWAPQSSGDIYGVSGRSDSSSGAGVYGSATAGLGGFNFGVLGDSQGHAAGASGVRGRILGAQSAILAMGSLGYNASAGIHYGVFSTGDYGGTGAKYFVEPHPQDPNLVIRYVSLEGPESGTYFRGRGKFQNGVATIEVPEDFRLVTASEGLSVVATPIGSMATIAVAAVGLDRIVLKASRNVEFFYIVNGVRKSHKDLSPIGPGREYMPESADARMPLYLTEFQKQMLVSNGTYKSDGTVNLETAHRLGWDKEWEKRNPPVAHPESN